jgi:hypothetical protein
VRRCKEATGFFRGGFVIHGQVRFRRLDLRRLGIVEQHGGRGRGALVRPERPLHLAERQHQCQPRIIAR